MYFTLIIIDETYKYPNDPPNLLIYRYFTNVDIRTLVDL